LLQPLPTRLQSQHRRVRHQCRPACEVITRLDAHAHHHVVEAGGQFQAQAAQRLLQRAGIDQVTKQRVGPRRHLLATVHRHHGAPGAALDAHFEALDAGDGVAAERKVRQPQGLSFLVRGGGAGQKCVRHGFAGGVEHPQVGEVGAQHALIHRLWQLKLEQRLRATGFDRDAKSKIGGALGKRSNGPQAQQPGANASSHARSPSFGGTGAR
jgi:hypothetical protein